MKSPDDRTIAAELSALRPEPRPEFAAELDARVAAGFPAAGGGVGARAGRRGPRAAWAALGERLRARPRLLLAPGGALALTVVLVAAVIVLGDEDGGAPVAIEDGGGAAGGQSVTSAPQRAGEGDGSSGFERASSPEQYAAPLSEVIAPNRAGADAASSPDGAAEPATGAEPLPPTRSGPYASGRRQRAVERSARLVLGAEPEAVRGAAAEVFAVVHRHDGIVLRSSIAEGGEGEAGASFELLIPSGRLGDALAGFSSIAEVRSRREQSADITAQTVSTGERLQDANASIRSLLAQLAAADSEAERAVAEAELRAERRHAAALRGQLNGLKRRANLSRVSLTIVSGEAGAPPPGTEDGSWGVGAALQDAGRVLEVIAGILLVGLAVIAPLALLALLIWAGRRTALRRARERALG